VDRRVAIFCSSCEGIDSRYNVAARDLVAALCAKGYVIVSGGSYRGMMGVVSDTVRASGGFHEGVIPRFMAGWEYPSLDSLVWTDTMAHRKELIRKDTCAVVALPGGIGTLDEFIETHVLAKLGRYEGRVIAFNVDGFYDPLKALLDHYVEKRMMHQADRDLALFPESVDQVMDLIDAER